MRIGGGDLTGISNVIIGLARAVDRLDRTLVALAGWMAEVQGEQLRAEIDMGEAVPHSR